MFGCFNITPRGLQAVSNNCINLISLHLGQCYKVSVERGCQVSREMLKLRVKPEVFNIS